MKEQADVVIIGAGAGGATVGGELAEAGAKVVFLEAGKDLDITFGSSGHFASTQTFSRFAKDNLLWHEQYAGRPWRTDMGECAGGGTTTYGGVLEESLPRDYDKWPISYAELSPHVELAKRRFHVGRWPLSELSHSAKLLAEASGGQLGPVQSAFNQEPWEEYGVFHGRCKQCRCCLLGCKNNAKANALTITLPKAKWYGAEVRDNCLATRLQTDRGGSRVTSVRYLKRTGTSPLDEKFEEREIAADKVILAAGSMMTPMILHWSGSSGRALANSSGQVGKNLRAHFFFHLLGVLRRDDVRTYQGQVVEVCDRFNNYDSGFLTEFNMVAPPALMSMIIDVAKVENLDAMLGLPFKRLMRQYNRLINVTPMARNADDGFTDNFVLPHPTEKNQYKLPLPQVRLDPTRQEKIWMENGLQRAMEVLLRADADPQKIWPGRMDVVHKVGTCRMGQSPGDSVVDLHGKSWDLDNLWIADGSIFPAPLLANCSLIIYSLAYRIADKILGRTIPAA